MKTVYELAYIWKMANERATQLKRLLQIAQEEEQKAKEDLASTTGPGYEGSGVKVDLITRKGNVDYKTIPILQGMDLDPYRTPTIHFWSIKASTIQ